MPQEIVRDRTLIQGVSQQAEDLRRPGQLTAMENAWPSPVEGNGKRPGSRYLGKLSDDPYTDALTHAIDRDRDEKYGLLLSHETLVVSDELGTTYTVIGADNLVGTDEEASAFTDESRWVSPFRAEAVDTRHIKNAHADPDGGMRADLISWEAADTDNYIELSLDDELFSSFEPSLFRLRLKDKDSSLGIVYIQWTDGAGSNNYASIDLRTGTMKGDSGADSTRTKITALDDDWYLLEILFAHSTVTASTTTDIKIYPSGEIADGPGPGPKNVGSGGVYLYRLEIININSVDLSYLACEKPQLLTSNKDFNSGDWTASIGATPVDATQVGPYGYSTYQSLQKSIGGTLGTFTQVQGEFFAGPQLISCFFKYTGFSIEAEGVRLRFRDTSNTVDHDALFVWDGNGDLTCSEQRQDILDYGVIDHGHGHYQAWASIDTNHTASATAAGDSRSVAVGVDDSDSGSNRYIYAWGAMLVDGVAHIKDAPFMDPNESLDAVTVQDSTFVSNAEILPTMTTSKATGDDSTSEAYVFVQQAAYDTQYQVSVQFGDTVVTEYAQVSKTVDTQDNAFDTWEWAVSDLAAGGSWTLVVAGNNCTVTSNTSGARAYQDLTTKMAREINAVCTANGVRATASSFAAHVTIRSTDITAGLTVTKGTMPASEVSTLTQVIDGISGGDKTLERADTALIAETLAGLLDATTGLTATAKNSVIKLEVTDGQPLSRVEVKDGVGNQYITRIWKSIDFFDKLPTTCQDGAKILVAGDPEQGEDDYYVRFDADNADEFGPGVWREDIQTGTLDEFDGTTMPYQLTRRQDNSVGSWTHNPNSVFFTWTKVNWTKARVGSADLNPQPSFVGKPITGIFYWKDRLGFMSNENVILSEASRFENFWRTTVRTLVDSDPIDASAGTKDVVSFNHAVLTDQRIFLFSELSVFELLGTPLTPKTVELRKRLDERNSRRCTPVSLGRTALFAYQNSQFTRLKEITQVGDDLFDAPDITAVVPKFIPGEPVWLRGSSVENLVLQLSDGDRSTLYVYKFFLDGQQKVQSSWGTWTFGSDSRILGAVFLQSRILLYIERDDGVFLESIDVGDGLVDDGSTFRAHIDRMITSDHPEVSSVFSGGDTTFTLPYAMDDLESYQAWTAAGDSAGEGMRIAGTTTPTTTTIVLPGADYTERSLFFGQLYMHDLELNKPLRKDQGPDQRAVYLEGRVHALRMAVAFESAARFQFKVDTDGRATQTTTYEEGLNTGSGLSLQDGTISAPTRENARKLTVRLVNDQATPANFLSVEHIVEHTPRA